MQRRRKLGRERCAVGLPIVPTETVLVHPRHRSSYRPHLRGSTPLAVNRVLQVEMQLNVAQLRWKSVMRWYRLNCQRTWLSAADSGRSCGRIATVDSKNAVPCETSDAMFSSAETSTSAAEAGVDTVDSHTGQALARDACTGSTAPPSVRFIVRSTLSQIQCRSPFCLSRPLASPALSLSLPHLSPLSFFYRPLSWVRAAARVATAVGAAVGAEVHSTTEVRRRNTDIRNDPACVAVNPDPSPLHRHPRADPPLSSLHLRLAGGFGPRGGFGYGTRPRALSAISLAFSLACNADRRRVL